MAAEPQKSTRGALRENVVWPAPAQQVLTHTRLEQFSSERIFVGKGRHLVVEGSAESSIFFQLTGWSSVECVSHRGDRVVLDFLGPGDFVGIDESGDYAGQTVTALTDVAALRIEPSQFRALMDDDPLFRDVLISALQNMLLRTKRRRLALSGRSGAAKVREVLADLAARAEGLGTEGRNLRLPITQVLLACAVGLTPVAVNRIVQSLRRDGVLDWSASGVRVLDLDRLIG